MRKPITSQDNFSAQGLCDFDWYFLFENFALCLPYIYIYTGSSMTNLYRVKCDLSSDEGQYEI